MYSLISEAFNGSLKKQVTKLDASSDNLSELEYYPVINAQGDLDESELPTIINNESIKVNNLEDISSLSSSPKNTDFDKESFKSIDSNSKLSSLNNVHFVPEESEQNHDYYINTFVNQLNENKSTNTSVSMTSDDDVYKHVSKCKICKKSIKRKLRKYKDNYDDTNTNTNTNTNNSLIEAFSNININDINSNEYYKMNKQLIHDNAREITIIILLGIFIIFILDSFCTAMSRCRR